MECPFPFIASLRLTVARSSDSVPKDAILKEEERLKAEREKRDAKKPH